VVVSSPRTAALALLAAALSFSACGRARDAGSTVELWALGREGEVVAGLMPELERRVPGLRVRVQQIPWSAAHEKLLTAYVGDAMPDVFQVGNTWIPEFVALNAVEDLGEWIGASKSVAAGDFFPGILDANVIAGRTYGMPWYVDTRLLFYRSDLLQAADRSAPRTWDDWMDAMAAVKRRAGADRFAIVLPMNEWQPPVILALELGADLLRGDGEYANFRSAEFRRAFEFYLDLFRKGLAPRAAETQVSNLYQDFAEAFFASFVSGPWNVGELRRRLPADFEEKWQTAPMPAPDAAHPGVSLAGGASLAVFRGSHHKREAWQVIEYLLEDAQQLELYRLTGDLPARARTWSHPELGSDPKVRAFRAQLDQVRATPKIPEWERIADMIADSAEAAIRGELSPDAALERLDAQVDALLEKRRWLLARARSG
jgi:multiple sugar transport system substrate-binding protein